MRPSLVWKTLHLAARRYVHELCESECPIDPSRISRAVIAVHALLPEADYYHDLIERDVLE
jgi:hypothetical protein